MSAYLDSEYESHAMYLIVRAKKLEEKRREAQMSWVCEMGGKI